MERIKPLLKKVFLTVIIVIAFVVLSLIFLPFFINHNNYKSTIEEKFTTATGRRLVISGPISLSLFPTIHVNAKQVAILNPPQIKAGYFIEVPSIDFSINFLPLLKGSFHFAEITIDGLTLNFIKSKEANNWDFPQPKDKQAQSTANIVIDRLALTNTKLSYETLEESKAFSTKTFSLLINQEKGRIKYNNDQLAFNNASIDLNRNLRGIIDFSLTYKPNISYKGNVWFRSNSLAEVANVLNYKLPNYLKKLGSDFKMSTKLNGAGNELDLNNLQLTFGDTSINGNINIGLKPYQIKNNLQVNRLEVQDFVNLQGFKLKVESIDLIGSFSTDTQMRISSLNGQEMVKAQTITLYGLDLRKVSNRTTKVINDISIFRRLITYTHTLETVKLLRQAIEKIKGERGKNHEDKTSLGQFKGTIAANKGSLTIKECKLTGPNLEGLCSGGLNLKNNKLNFVFQGRILSQEQQTVINYIYFPYYIRGSFDHLSDGLDWPYIIKQTTNYYKENK